MEKGEGDRPESNLGHRECRYAVRRHIDHEASGANSPSFFYNVTIITVLSKKVINLPFLCEVYLGDASLFICNIMGFTVILKHRTEKGLIIGTGP